jgi:hypothetical protein
MPLLYTNLAGVNYSEAELTLKAPREKDWTESNAEQLSLWFRGNSSNAPEPMYVAISNRFGVPAVVAHDDPVAARVDDWTPWYIPLQAFADQGINLTNVDTLAIGLGSRSGMGTSGGSGTVFIDDIRLYPGMSN